LDPFVFDSDVEIPEAGFLNKEEAHAHTQFEHPDARQP
jgi:hypothetical protein